MTESKPAPNEAAAAVRATRRTVAAGAAALALSALAIVRLLGARMSWPPAEALMLSRGTGWVALSFLLLSLSISPVARIARRAGVNLAGAGVVRRALGMTAAWCALAHALSALGGSLAWDFAALIGWPHLSAGLAALAILLLLLATSFTRVVVSLRLALWKELHRLAYAAALFVLAHLMLAPFAPRALTLALFAATFLLGLARFLQLPHENRAPIRGPLRTLPRESGSLPAEVPVRILVKVLVSAIVIAVAPQLLPNVQVSSFGAALWAAIVYGILTVVIGWLVTLFTVVLSIVPGILTFGLFFFLVPWIANAILLKLTAGLLASFYIGSWGSAFLLGLLLSIAHILVDPDRERRWRRVQS